jgi:hypothetical protein
MGQVFILGVTPQVQTVEPGFLEAARAEEREDLGAVVAGVVARNGSRVRVER